jgi:hypothetical protein
MPDCPTAVGCGREQDSSVRSGFLEACREWMRQLPVKRKIKKIAANRNADRCGFSSDSQFVFFAITPSLSLRVAFLLLADLR